MNLLDRETSKSRLMSVDPMLKYAKCVSPCTTAMTRSCVSASTISTFAPSRSKRSVNIGSHRSHLFDGVIITVCPRIAGMLGPNIGCVPITSTPSGAHLSIASSGIFFIEVISMRRLPRFIFGAISSIVSSVTSMGTDITTISLSWIAASRSCAYIAPNA